MYNDPVLTQHLAATLEGVLGKGTVVTEDPIMTSEDYAYFVEQGVPSFYFTLGVADPQKLAEAQAAGRQLPSNHSPLFAPVAEPFSQSRHDGRSDDPARSAQGNAGGREEVHQAVDGELTKTYNETQRHGEARRKTAPRISGIDGWTL